VSIVPRGHELLQPTKKHTEVGRLLCIGCCCLKQRDLMSARACCHGFNGFNDMGGGVLSGCLTLACLPSSVATT
jgi:hypothetical protein